MDKPKLAGSVCIRCGKNRILSRVWVEKDVRGTPVTHTEAVCPDPECQKIVDEDFAAKREKKFKLIQDKADNKAAQEAIKAKSSST